MPQLPWLERTWEFAFPASLYPSIVERLRGTPTRLEELLADVPRERLVRHIGGTWSIQENAGHLLTLENLPATRLCDFLEGKETLTAWDTTNCATEEAHYDDAELTDILVDFRAAREELVARLDALALADFERTALHPRLEAPMRLIDMCLFQADHDDHHLARIRELLVP